MTNIDSKVLDWFINGETGVSSETMAAYLTGRKPSRPASTYPSDPGDLGRCLCLLDAVPELRDRLPKMAELCPVWAALVARWSDIERSMRGEVGIRWEKGRNAPMTYKLMRSIIDVA